jgi:NADPH:quinone reductase-like Zn-dependent oxidoreductase
VQLPTVESRENLLTVARHAEAGTLRPVVDRTYPLAGTADAVSHVEQGHARGKVVVTVT